MRLLREQTHLKLRARFARVCADREQPSRCALADEPQTLNQIVCRCTRAGGDCVRAARRRRSWACRQAARSPSARARRAARAFARTGAAPTRRRNDAPQRGRVQLVERERACAWDRRERRVFIGLKSTYARALTATRCPPRVRRARACALVRDDARARARANRRVSCACVIGSALFARAAATRQLRVVVSASARAAQAINK